MNQKIISIVLVVALIVGVVYLTKHKDAFNGDASSLSSSSSPSSPSSPSQVAPPVQNHDPQSSVQPVSEAVYGDPKAKNTVRIGYTWTPKLQADRKELNNIILLAAAWAKTPGRGVVLTCVDIPIDERDIPADESVALGISTTAAGVAPLNGAPGVDISSEQFKAFLAGIK